VDYGTGLDPSLIILSDFRLSSFPGDFDSDGDVDGRDFLAWQRNPSVGDLSDWQENYGTGSLQTSSVPEPMSSAILAIAAMSAFTRRPFRCNKSC
jgi:hypothetical protein